MRRRDIHAIAFSGVTIPLLFACAMFLSRSCLIAFCVTAAYAILLFTRPRMIRVMRRLTGRGGRYEGRGYYDD